MVVAISVGWEMVVHVHPLATVVGIVGCSCITILIPSLGIETACYISRHEAADGGFLPVCVHTLEGEDHVGSLVCGGKLLDPCGDKDLCARTEVLSDVEHRHAPRVAGGIGVVEKALLLALSVGIQAVVHDIVLVWICCILRQVVASCMIRRGKGIVCNHVHVVVIPLVVAEGV